MEEAANEEPAVVEAAEEGVGIGGPKVEAEADGGSTLDEEIAEIEQTAPDLPWELTLKNSATYFQKLPGGRMVLKFVPIALTPQGAMMTPPGIEIVFGADGWERFKEEVAADGEKPPEKPVIQTARALPPKMAIPQGRRR